MMITGEYKIENQSVEISLCLYISCEPGKGVRDTLRRMVSSFLPMGPSPIMGEFVIYVSRDRVHDIDIDISVEEGLQASVTSGITMSEQLSSNSSQGYETEIGESSSKRHQAPDLMETSIQDVPLTTIPTLCGTSNQPAEYSSH